MSTMMTESELAKEHPPQPKPSDVPGHVVVNLGELRISKTALKAVEHSFNSSQNLDVARIKLLSAYLITHCEAIRARPFRPVNDPPNVTDVQWNDSVAVGARRASVAITNYEDACMWAVKAIFS